MYFISKRIFIKEQTKMSFTPDSVFEEIINKTTKTFLSSSKNLQNTLRKPLVGYRQSNANTSQKNFFTLMKEAYLHPAEKNITNNPIQIWNDSYNFIKSAETAQQAPSKLIEYENIIKRERKSESLLDE